MSSEDFFKRSIDAHRRTFEGVLAPDPRFAGDLDFGYVSGNFVFGSGSESPEMQKPRNVSYHHRDENNAFILKAERTPFAVLEGQFLFELVDVVRYESDLSFH